MVAYIFNKGKKLRRLPAKKGIWLVFATAEEYALKTFLAADRRFQTHKESNSI